MATILNEEEIKRYWELFSDDFDKMALGQTMPLLQLMIPLLNLESSTSIVEVGCGTGHSFDLIRQHTPASVKILANDFSKAMVSKSLSKNSENVEVVIASNTALPYDDGCCDRYISNLSLHIVPDPKLMLAEALRVMQPGAIGIFSVWGKKTPSNIFAILGKASLNAGIQQLARSQFYLNDQNELNNLLKEAGFVNVKSFYTTIGIDLHTGQDVIDYVKSIPHIAIHKDSNPEKYHEILENVRKESDAVLETGNAITFEALVVVGNKPR